MLDKLKSILSSGPKSAMAILALIVAWMLIGAIFNLGDSSEDRPEAPLAKNTINEVLVERIQAEAIHREISILGETQYSRSVVISALINGTVTAIPGAEGELISKKKTIVKLDDREARAEFQHAKSLEEQKQLEFEGFEKLFKEELISPARFAEAKSQLENAKAKKVQKQIQLDSTALKLPFDGILQKVFVEQGDYVREGQEIAEVLDFSPFIVTGAVSEKEAVYIEQGLPADARLIDGSIFHGTISYKSVKADKESRSFKIEMEVENKEDHPVLAGISSTITIPVTHDKAHRISSSSLEIDDQGKFGVKTINEDNLVSFHNVEVLKSSNTGIWVNGLPDITNVIVRGQGFVKAGDIVKPVFKQSAESTNPQKPEEKAIGSEQSQNPGSNDQDKLKS
jgi:multidrug efflux system membrane fusion protein